MDKWLYEALRDYGSSDALPMHMPGHKRNAARFPWLTGAEMDITEIDGFDNLNDPESLFLELSQRISKLWGAKQSFPLVNGSTVGVLASVLSALPPGGTALIARGCHKSVYHGCELARANLRYLTPEVDPWGIWRSVTPESVEAALEADTSIRLVVITSPTYEGVLSDVLSISKICHRYGIPLLVDEAHGAHLGFGGFPEGAVRQGADLVVQSLHKTLPSPTQTAVLHLSGELVEAETVARSVAMLQSSSPSYLLTAGLDGCVRFMEQAGDRECRRWLSILDEVDREIVRLHTLQILFRQTETDVFKYDPSKIVLSAASAGLSGYALAERLRRGYGIELEMASPRVALAMTGLGDTETTISRLLTALRDLDGTLNVREAELSPLHAHLPPQCMPIHEAVRKPRTALPPEEALGRVSAEYVWLYPPGAPLLTPGELVDAETLEVLREAGGTVRSSYHGLPQRIFCITA